MRDALADLLTPEVLAPDFGAMLPAQQRHAPSRGWTVPTPEARRARALVRSLVRAGRLIKPSACELCEIRSKKLEAAHVTYKRPTVVFWLCVSCHRRWDHALPKGGT